MLKLMLLADALAPSTETTLIGAITTGVAALVVALLRAFAKQKAEERRRMIANFAEAAYLITAEVALRTETKIDDKAAFALRELHTALEKQGALNATPAEEARAELMWQAMHGQEKLLEKLGMVPAVPK